MARIKLEDLFSDLLELKSNLFSPILANETTNQDIVGKTLKEVLIYLAERTPTTGGGGGGNPIPSQGLVTENVEDTV